MGVVTEVTYGLEPMSEARRKVGLELQAHGDLINQYADAWYRAKYTWTSTNVFGVATMKSPTDLWAYHELLWKHRPTTVLETGTARGGSALWFAVLMDILGIEGGQVITIDTKPEIQPPAQHPRILSITGDSSDPEVAAAALARVTHPLLVSLDSEHSEEHVAKELALYAPHVAVGEYLIVEDTNISWPDDRGPWGALEAFLAVHDDEWFRDVYCERYWLTMHPHGWLQRVKECGHERGGDAA